MASNAPEEFYSPDRSGENEFSEQSFLENIGTESGDDAAEAARIGMADHSQSLGAAVDPDVDYIEADEPPTGGGLSSHPEQAKVVGDEAVGGTVSVPDQDVVDDIAESVGVEMRDEHPLRVTDEMYGRDERRWELEPESADRPDSAQPWE